MSICGIFLLICIISCQISFSISSIENPELKLILGQDYTKASSLEIIHPEIVSAADGTSHLLRIKSRSEKFVLYLVPSHPVVPKNDFVYWSTNTVNVETYTRCKHCYFSGRGVDKPVTASFTIFDGLRGILTTLDASFYIHPVNKNVKWDRSANFSVKLVESPHYFIEIQDKGFGGVIDRRKRNADQARSNYLPQSSPYQQVPYYENGPYYNQQNSISQPWQQKPLLTQYYIETAVFVDEALYKKYLKEYGRSEPDKLNIFLLSLISNVDHLLSHHSLGGVLKLVLVHSEIFKEQPVDLDTMNGDIDGYLKNFCEWQEKLMKKQPYGYLGQKLHWDHAILLTGVDLHRKDSRSGRKNTSYVGYAYVNGMCNPKFSCTINEGTSFRGVFVTAHEMGHSMGMTHDGQDQNYCDGSSFLMSPSLHPKIGRPKTSWSTCSQNQLHNFLRSSQSKCLENVAAPPQHLDFHKNDFLPGDNFSPDQQCQVLCGKQCRAHISQQPNEMCEALACERDNKIRTAHQALQGTRCDENKKCLEGKCTFWLKQQQTSQPSSTTKPPAPKWQSHGRTCQSSCLLGRNQNERNQKSWGIIHESRICAHPSQCEGRNLRPRLCDHSKICKNYNPAINVDNYADGICRQESLFRDENILPISARLPYNNPKKSCQIWCKQREGGYINRLWVLPDGSPCEIITPGNKAYCVQGSCVQFGCDGLPLEFSDPSTCREAVQWPNGQFSGTSNTIVTNNHLNSPIATNDCHLCLYNSVNVVDSTKTCDAWGKCSIHLKYQHKPCVCHRSADDYAAQKCNSLRHQYQNLLSGYGKMLMSTSGDEHLSCYVCCESKQTAKLFYKMEDPLELMPDGTRCSRDDQQPKYCYQGQCLSGTLTRRKRAIRNFERFHTGLGRSNVLSGISFVEDAPLQTIKLPPSLVSTSLKIQQNKVENADVDLFIGRMQPQFPAASFRWQTIISDCDQSGQRKVHVSCISSNDSQPSATHNCDNQTKPDLNRTEKCQISNYNAAHDFIVNMTHHKTEWKIGVWSQCLKIQQKSCIGSQSRSISCVMKLGNENVRALVGDQYCNQPKPVTMKKCFIKKCYRYEESSSSPGLNSIENLRFINVQDLMAWIKKHSVSKL